MKALVITGSRADRNGLEVVHEALLAAGHESSLIPPYGSFLVNHGDPDIAVIGGDRIEILEVAISLAKHRIPIAHIAGGDVTEGSADDRYRDAITALSCVHFATNERAHKRLTGKWVWQGRCVPEITHVGDSVYFTGSPAIDRIKRTPVLTERETYEAFGLQAGSHAVLVSVHPNTIGDDSLLDLNATLRACAALPETYRFACLGANADAGGETVNQCLRSFVRQNPGSAFRDNVPPQLYYSLMTHCDVMIGNSSAMLYEAPCFGLPCVLVGERQKGRVLPENVMLDMGNVERAIRIQPRWRPRVANPYGDGQSAPRIVKALEENSWRWSSKTS